MYHTHLIISHLIKNSINRVHSIGSSAAVAIANAMRSSVLIIQGNIKGNIKGEDAKEFSASVRWRRAQVRPGFLNLRAFGLVSVLCLASFLTACVSSSGSGAGPGAGPIVAPDVPDPVLPGPRSLFSHASYNLVGLGTTMTNATADERILGVVDLDPNSLLELLPAGVSLEDLYAIDFRLEGSELAEEFFEVNDLGEIRLSAFNNYGRDFQLDYVVNVLNVSEFEVEVGILYTNITDGTLVEVEFAEESAGRVSVQIAAVDELLGVSDLIRFEGVPGGGSVEQEVPEDRAYTGRFRSRIEVSGREFAAFLGDGDDASVVVDYATVTSDEYTADPAELGTTPAPGENRQRGRFDVADILGGTPLAVNQRLDMAVTLVLTNDSGVNYDNVTGNYAIEMGTELSVINGNSSASFAAFLEGIDEDRPEDLINSEETGFGVNVSAVIVSFDFDYMRLIRVLPSATTDRLYVARGSVAEHARDGILVGGLTNPMTDLGIRALLPAHAAALGYASLPTLYYELSSVPLLDEPAFSCGERYYVDNQGGRIRVLPEIESGYALDYESGDRSNICVLQVSLNGVDYENVTTGRLSAEALVAVRRLVGTATADSALSCTNNVTAVQASASCSYYARIDIDLTDVNEAPVLELSAEEFTTPEGDLGLALNRSDAEIVAGGPVPSLSGIEVLAIVDYSARDLDANNNALRTVSLPEIVSVVPELPVSAAALFAVRRGMNAGQAELILNRRLLSAVNFEDPALAEAADAFGRRGYRVLLRLADNRSAALTTEVPFMLEVTDVVYKPVELRYVDPAFRYNNATGEEILNLLPGFAQFIDNGGPVLGTVEAIDPESGTDAEIVYTYNRVPPPPVGEGPGPFSLNPSIFGQLIAANVSESEVLGAVIRQIAPSFDLKVDGSLSLLGLGLRPLSDYDLRPVILPPGRILPSDLDYDFTINLVAYHSAVPLPAPANVATLSLRTKVAYRTIVGEVGARPAVTFPRGLYTGAVLEGIPGTGNPAPLGVSVLDLLSLQTEQPMPLQLGASGQQCGSVLRAHAAGGLTGLYRGIIAGQTR